LSRVLNYVGSKDLVSAEGINTGIVLNHWGYEVPLKIDWTLGRAIQI
jgi:hypothetical protein